MNKQHKAFLDAATIIASRIDRIELAEKLGVSKQIVGAWCNGTLKLPPGRAKQISELTGGEITIESLLY